MEVIVEVIIGMVRSGQAVEIKVAEALDKARKFKVMTAHIVHSLAQTDVIAVPFAGRFPCNFLLQNIW